MALVLALKDLAVEPSMARGADPAIHCRPLAGTRCRRHLVESRLAHGIGAGTPCAQEALILFVIPESRSDIRTAFAEPVPDLIRKLQTRTPMFASAPCLRSPACAGMTKIRWSTIPQRVSTPCQTIACNLRLDHSNQRISA
ncbi:MAG: hypothetical protein ACREPY_11905 [Rhodanobacteraceae bacterium]